MTHRTWQIAKAPIIAIEIRIKTFIQPKTTLLVHLHWIEIGNEKFRVPKDFARIKATEQRVEPGQLSDTLGAAEMTRGDIVRFFPLNNQANKESKIPTVVIYKSREITTQPIFKKIPFPVQWRIFRMRMKATTI